jgi:hypothetical protein
MVDNAFAASAGTISLDAIIESRVHDRPARGEAAKGGRPAAAAGAASVAVSPPTAATVSRHERAPCGFRRRRKRCYSGCV